ncbi:hypothetical protein R75461_08239 [Paraburkholderia nemoris]|nr:hypothetical protein R75461_08239 [Paraburkholderia nemoris]
MKKISVSASAIPDTWSPRPWAWAWQRSGRQRGCPIPFITGTPEFVAAEEAFLRDVLRALGGDPDEPEPDILDLLPSPS